MAMILQVWPAGLQQCWEVIRNAFWELENIILSEVSLAQKTKNRMFSLICGH
jgi:hypothetical protein